MLYDTLPIKVYMSKINVKRTKSWGVHKLIPTIEGLESRNIYSEVELYYKFVLLL